jgi:hypothetical protein
MSINILLISYIISYLLYYYYYYYYYYYCCCCCCCSTALCWAFPAFSVSCSYTQLVGLLGRRSARRKAATYTQDNTNRHTQTYDLSGIRIHYPRVRVSEHRPCLRSRGHCDLQLIAHLLKIKLISKLMNYLINWLTG